MSDSDIINIKESILRNSINHRKVFPFLINI